MRLHPELSRLGKLVLSSYRSFSALYHRLKIFFHDKKKKMVTIMLNGKINK